MRAKDHPREQPLPEHQRWKEGGKEGRKEQMEGGRKVDSGEQRKKESEKKKLKTVSSKSYEMVLQS